MKTTPRLGCLLLAALPAWAAAHEGHGMPGTEHWHAHDVLGFVGLAVVVLGVLWWRHRK